MIFQAHRGVCCETPENTMPAFVAALEQGYQIIELDVSVTKDLKFVTLHDNTINRTARLDSGEPLADTVNIWDITYQEALAYDYGVWFSKKFKGTKIPLFEDVLKFAKQNGIKLKIDNKYQGFSCEQKNIFFDLLKPYTDVACLTCSDMEELCFAAACFPDMHFHYDGPVSLEILEKLAAVLPKERLTVWLPHKNPSTSWVKVEFASKERAQLVKKYASLGVWILSRNDQLEEAEALGADLIETGGQLKPSTDKRFMADMHTHSEVSHDSVCKIEEMLQAQLEHGTNIFAVTDHFDTASQKKLAAYAPIEAAHQTIQQLNRAYTDRALVLSGIEIGEGFWHPDVAEKALTLVDYDVVVGSVHLVQYKDLTYAYSCIPFSELTRETVIEYVDAYFDDILTMIDTVDFDILAHLTCPLRYIVGKYKIELDISRYAEKIKSILQKIIKKGIALEINTSSLGMLHEFMPPADILSKYYDMGGYLITLGSDAHCPENASLYFDEAIQAIKAIGFKNIYYYKKRIPYQIKI